MIHSYTHKHKLCVCIVFKIYKQIDKAQDLMKDQERLVFLPLAETAAREAKVPQAAAFAPEVCTSASASAIMSPVETPFNQTTRELRTYYIYKNVIHHLHQG